MKLVGKFQRSPSDQTTWSNPAQWHALQQIHWSDQLFIQQDEEVWLCQKMHELLVCHMKANLSLVQHEYWGLVQWLIWSHLLKIVQDV